jgi:hypothetical protein
MERKSEPCHIEWELPHLDHFHPQSIYMGFPTTFPLVTKASST